MTAGRTIDYESLAQDAMRGVVRTVLTRTAKSGLPGDHHFYISFDTKVNGVSLSKRLKEKYPEEMTIVLQHRFWDLSVSEDRFEVKLTFDSIPERLVVPFAAIKVFFDPSVRYGLQFEDPGFGPDAMSHPVATGNDALIDGPEGDNALTTSRTAASRKRSSRKPKLEKVEDTGSAPSRPTAVPSGDPPRAVPPAPPLAAAPAPKPVELKPASQPAGPSGAQIVSLSDFRKK